MDKDLEKIEAEEKLFAEPSEEQLQQEIQEIIRKREAYQKQQEKELQELREEKKSANRRRLNSVAKIAVLVLVVGTCFVMLSTQSEATRMWWLKATNRDIGQESENVVNNDDNRMLSAMNEKEAIAEMEEKTGIPMPELLYKPEGMVFDQCEYGKENTWGKLYYLYNEYLVTIKGYSPEADTAYAGSYSGEIIKEGLLEIEYGDVNIQEIQAKNDNVSTTVARWNYKNHLYWIEGKIPFEEMKKIIENIFY